MKQNADTKQTYISPAVDLLQRIDYNGADHNNQNRRPRTNKS